MSQGNGTEVAYLTLLMGMGSPRLFFGPQKNAFLKIKSMNSLQTNSLKKKKESTFLHYLTIIYRKESM